jgi:hypothetical protein
MEEIVSAELAEWRQALPTGDIAGKKIAEPQKPEKLP